MTMEKSKISQLLRILLLLILLIITPSVPGSLRSPYLYFLFNIFIVALGVEAGLLSAISGPIHDQKPSEVSLVNISSKDVVQQEVKQVEKPVMAEKVVAVARVHRVKKSRSTPSLFFIGGGDEGQFIDEETVEEDDEDDEYSAQELFAKAEMFIGNFYKQLKMQREESWKKIHGFYHKAF